MIGETFTLLRSNGRGCASEPEDELGTVHRLVALVLSVVIAGSTVFAVSMPFALLHLR